MVGPLVVRGREIEAAELGAAGVLVLAVALRFYQLAEDSLWLDEVYTVVVWPRKDLFGLFFGGEPHPPLYFFLSNVWVSVFGQSTFAARALPALCGVGLVAVTMYAGRVFGDERAGLLAGLLTAVAPVFIHFSQTARMYSLWATLTVLSMTGFAAVLYRREEPLLLYLLGTVGMLYTHAFGVFFVALQNGYYLVTYPFEPRPESASLQAWVRLQLVVGLLSLPVVLKYAAVLLATVAGGAESSIGWLTTPTVDQLVDAVVSFGGYPIYYPNVVDSVFVYRVSVGVLALLTACGAYGLARAYSSAETDRPDNAQLVLVAWLVGSVVVPFVVSYVVPLFTARNVHVAVVPLFVLAAIGITRVPDSPFDVSVSPLRLAVVMLLVGGLLVSTGAYYDQASGEDWRGAVAYIEANDAEGDVILTVPSWAQRPVRYYASDNSRIVGWNESRSLANVSDSRRQWVVSRYPTQGEALRRELNATNRLVSDRQFGTVRVTLFADS